jgi:protein ImuA
MHALDYPLPWRMGQGEAACDIAYGVRPSCSASDREVAYPGSDPIPLPASATDELQQQRIAALRRCVARLERASHSASPACLSLGLANAPAGLRLVCGALNEIVAAAHGDTAAAFGFLVAAMAGALAVRPGPAMLVASRRSLADFGAPYGHGLAGLGLDVGRLLLVATRNDKDALWALEEALRSGSRPAVVAGALTRGLDLTSSRRLNLAAASQGTPLALLRPPAATGATAAVTRWRIASAPAARDAFGTLAGPRWRVALERCRNGRTGEWLLEWDHVAHRFRLVESVADCAPHAVARVGLGRTG